MGEQLGEKLRIPLTSCSRMHCFVPDLTRENVEIVYKVRKAARRAREKYTIL